MNNVMITSQIEVGVDELIEHISECFDTYEVEDVILRLDLNQADFDFTTGLICKLLDSIRADVREKNKKTFDELTRLLVSFLYEEREERE